MSSPEEVYYQANAMRINDVVHAVTGLVMSRDRLGAVFTPHDTLPRITEGRTSPQEIAYIYPHKSPQEAAAFAADMDALVAYDAKLSIEGVLLHVPGTLHRVMGTHYSLALWRRAFLRPTVPMSITTVNVAGHTQFDPILYCEARRHDCSDETAETLTIQRNGVGTVPDVRFTITPEEDEFEVAYKTAFGLCEANIKIGRLLLGQFSSPAALDSDLQHIRSESTFVDESDDIDGILREVRQRALRAYEADALHRQLGTNLPTPEKLDEFLYDLESAKD